MYTCNGDCCNTHLILWCCDNYWKPWFDQSEPRTCNSQFTNILVQWHTVFITFVLTVALSASDTVSCLCSNRGNIQVSLFKSLQFVHQQHAQFIHWAIFLNSSSNERVCVCVCVCVCVWWHYKTCYNCYLYFLCKCLCENNYRHVVECHTDWSTWVLLCTTLWVLC